MKRCAKCETTINEEEGYYTYRDNYLQQKFFEDEEYNVFCSKKCAGDFLFLELIYETEVEE